AWHAAAHVLEGIPAEDPRRYAGRGKPLFRALPGTDRLAGAWRLSAQPGGVAFHLRAEAPDRGLPVQRPPGRTARLDRIGADDLAVVHAAAARARKPAPVQQARLPPDRRPELTPNRPCERSEAIRSVTCAALNGFVP